MRRALMWLNVYGHEAVRSKLKNSLKTQKKHFLSVFELTLDSLSTIQVEPHQCPLHQSILLTQGPIHEILAEIAQLLVVVEKLSFFESAILNFFLLHSHKNQSKFIGQQGRAKILMITLISRKFLVCLYFCNTVYVQFVKSPYLLVLITYMDSEFSELFWNTFGQGKRNFFLLPTLQICCK